MANAALQYLPLIAALISLVIAVCALVRSQRASPATREKKPTPPSLAESSNALDSALAAEKITHQLAKLENRLRMREERDKARLSQGAPEVGASKADLFRHYGFTRVGPAFAQRQLDLERRQET